MYGCKLESQGTSCFCCQPTCSVYNLDRECAWHGSQVSHDLKEVAPLVDNAWSMKLGGTLEPVQWPPP
eukprot:1140289-Pelagomonas_calceolata.AAC.2